MPTVLVTGASGFIAKHIVGELITQGHRVRASVRSDRRKAEIEALFPEAGIDYVSLDLTSDAGWADALHGVDALIHTASPFPGAQPKDPSQVIRPAVDGTLRALRAAQAAGVTRVVLTSTVGAIYKPAGAGALGRVKTRADWTDPDGSKTTPYEASKTLAERAAWDFVTQHPEMQLTTINPGMVLGPAMDAHYGTSLNLVERILNRQFPMYPQMQMPVVDVRDVARVHVAALKHDTSIGQRFPLNAGALTVPPWRQPWPPPTPRPTSRRVLLPIG